MVAHRDAELVRIEALESSMQALHALKGHQILQWVLPSGHTVPAGTAEHTPHPGQISRMEHHLAKTIIEYEPTG